MDNDGDKSINLDLPDDDFHDELGDLEGLSDELPSDDVPQATRVYEEIRELGRGGMARVMLVEDAAIDREVAMKIALPQCQKNRSMLHRFLNEANITGQLDHPSIPPVHDAGRRPDGLHYFTMKWVRGRTLAEIVGTLREKADQAVEREYSLPTLLRIFQKVCEGVAFAHDRDIVHRDLKPENIMIGRFGQVFVMDWGLAKKLHEKPALPDQAPDPADDSDPALQTNQDDSDPMLSVDGTILGTPAYMAPEQASGRVAELDQKTDIYALGAMLYEILTFRPPPKAQTTVAVLMEVIRGEIIPPRTRTPEKNIPKDLEAVCLKAMATDKDRRFSSVSELMDEVQAFLDRRRVTSYDYGPFERLSRFVQRRPALSLGGLMATIFILAGTGLTGFLVQRGQLLEERAQRAELDRQQAEIKTLKAELKASKAEAKADTAEAKADTAEAKADNAEAKADTAEAKADTAEAKADTALSKLKKSRKVSAVHRLANEELAWVASKLRESYYSNDLITKKQETGKSLWPQVEAFCERVPKDSASQAAMLAVKGWLRRLAGFDDQAMALFRDSREADADVAHGIFFEASVHLSAYIKAQRMPGIATSGKSLRLSPVPPENDEMKAAREKFEGLLATVTPDMVWGETATKEFEEVFKGFWGMHSKDLDAAVTGLTKALSLSEMVWIRTEILHARAKVWFLKMDFPKGIKDIEEVLRQTPRDVDAHFTRAVLWFAQGHSSKFKGSDPRQAFTKSIAAYTEVLTYNRRDSRVFNARGMARIVNAGSLRRWGGDAKAEYLRALADFTAALDIEPEEILARTNRSMSYIILAKLINPGDTEVEEMYRKAIADCDKVISITQNSALAYRHRTEACQRLASILENAGKDPTALYRKAIGDYDFSIEKHPKVDNLYAERGNAHRRLGMALNKKGEDPRKTYERSILDYDEFIKRRPTNVGIINYRGLVHRLLADAMKAKGEDSRETYKLAIRDFTIALDLKPNERVMLLNRGIARILLGRAIVDLGESPTQVFPKSLKDFDQALRKNPRETMALYHRSEVLREWGRYLGRKNDATDPVALAKFKDALAAIDELVKLTPRHWLPFRQKGLILEDLGRFDEAYDALLRAVEFSKKPTSLLLKDVERVKGKRK
jgi:serine/threonine protein kinase